MNLKVAWKSPIILIKVCRFVLAAIVISTFVPIASAQVPFTKIAGSSATGGLGLSVPSINNSGTVAFVDTTSGHTGVFTGNGGALTTIYTTGNYSAYAPGSGGGLSVSINDLGRIAAVVDLPSTPESIFSTTGGSATTIAVANNTPVGNTGTVVLSRPTIANDNTVAFSAYHIGGFPGNGVFTGTGGPLNTVVLNSGSTAQLGVEPFASRTNNYLAYVAPATLGSSNTASVLHNSSTSTITLPAPLAGSFFAHIAINDLGMLAGTTIHGGGGGLMVGDGVNTLLVIRSSINDASSPFTNFDSISINHSNAIAFQASGGSFTGIFTGSTLASKIIATGDPLDGSTVSALGFGSEGLNDAGMITFYARLADGRQGIYIVAVPEPSAIVLLLLVMVLAPCLWYKYRQRRTDEIEIEHSA